MSCEFKGLFKHRSSASLVEIGLKTDLLTMVQTMWTHISLNLTNISLAATYQLNQYKPDLTQLKRVHVQSCVGLTKISLRRGHSFS